MITTLLIQHYQLFSLIDNFLTNIFFNFILADGDYASKFDANFSNAYSFCIKFLTIYLYYCIENRI